MPKKEQKIIFAGESEKPLSNYLRLSYEIIPKTVRAPDILWKRIEALARLKGSSVNSLIIAVLEKTCDDEGVA